MSGRDQSGSYAADTCFRTDACPSAVASIPSFESDREKSGKDLRELLRRYMNRLDAHSWTRTFFPRGLQIRRRKIRARYLRKAHRHQWPSDPASEKIPNEWVGWPDRKRFTLDQSQDVDKLKGYDQCIRLMTLESQMGLRSSFDFVPEDNPVSEEMRRTITGAGFEVAVHGLKHDGNPFQDRDGFRNRADWGAAGFHFPSMYHNLEWIADLAITYDNSTLYTDQFEPQPGGLSTIFPVRIENPSRTRSYTARSSPLCDPEGTGYSNLGREGRLDRSDRRDGFFEHTPGLYEFRRASLQTGRIPCGLLS